MQDCGTGLYAVALQGEGAASVIEMHGWDWPLPGGTWSAFDRQTRSGWNGTRPSLMRFVTSTDVRVHNVMLKNSPFWTCHFWACTRVHVRGVNVIALSRQNTDGACIVFLWRFASARLHHTVGDARLA